MIAASGEAGDGGERGSAGAGAKARGSGRTVRAGFSLARGCFRHAVDGRVANQGVGAGIEVKPDQFARCSMAGHHAEDDLVSEAMQALALYACRRILKTISTRR
jgi:hypothetical protein